MVAFRSVFVSFQADGVHFFGAAISDGRVKNASSFANATRTMSSAQTSMRRRPPAIENVGGPGSAGGPGRPRTPQPPAAATTTAMRPSRTTERITALNTADAAVGEARRARW